VTGSTDSTPALVVGLVAIVLAAVNMVGGFVVTDRMLQMFVRKRKPAVTGPEDAQDAAARGGKAA
jgi:NAD(P) transhydrogenase subunit alpha